MSATRMIFVNLPIRDLPRSIAFYEAAGATKNPQFSDETAACMVFSEAIHVMLLTHDKFMQFSPRPIAGRDVAQVLLCLSADSRPAVDDILAGIAAIGGKADPTPPDDHGFMYGRSFEDPDGHLWQVMHMDMEAFAAATGKA